MSAYVRQPAVRAADRQLALSVLCILLALYSTTFGGLPADDASEIDFQATSSLAREGSLALGGTPEAAALLARIDAEPRPASARPNETRALGGWVREGRADRAGRWYATTGVGQAVLSLPLYLVGRLAGALGSGVEARNRQAVLEGVERSEYFPHVFVAWRNALLAAAIAMLLVATCRRLDIGRRPAWLAGLTLGVATYLWPQARSSLADAQTAFFLFLAFYLIVRIREAFQRLTPPHPLMLAGLGLALGGAVLTEASSLPAVAVLGVAAFSLMRTGRAQFLVSGAAGLRRRTEKLRWISAFVAVPFVSCLLAGLWLDALRFGDPWASFSAVASTAVPSGAALGRLTFAPGHGLLWMAPAVLVAPIGIAAAWDEDERLFPWVLAGVLVAEFATVPEVALEPWSYGPRAVLPVVPFVWIAVAKAVDRAASHPWLRLATTTLFLLGVLAAVPAVLVDTRTYHDLALQAQDTTTVADVESPDEPVAGPAYDGGWSWRFAAPWVHWRILRHRVAGLGESFSARDLFGADVERALSPQRERDRGFRHLFWVDLEERLGGSSWPVLALATLLLAVGWILGARGLDPGRP